MIDQTLVDSLAGPSEIYIICPLCGYDRNATVMRTVKNLETVKEVGIDCAKCHKWTHSFFTSLKLTAMRQAWDKASLIASRMPGDKLFKAQASRRGKVYKRQFKVYNEMMRKKFGIVVEKEASVQDAKDLLQQP